MNSPFNFLAKIQIPHLSDVLQRTRLFKKLDADRQRPLIWIKGMAGAGKTTLISSYIKDRDLISLWYRIDPEDDELASFFHYLSLAANNSTAEGYPSLPVLTPEYVLGIPTFSRRYFEQLYTHFDKPFVIVLDNYERLPADSALHHIICQATESLPEFGTLLVVSRQAPPSTFARLRANSIIAEIDDSDLQLTQDETLAIAGLRKIELDSDQLLQLQQQTQGWVAGQILLLESKTPATMNLNISDSPQLVFDYLAEEIFNAQAAETRVFLLQAALLPEMTEQNSLSLTKNPNAGKILSDLAKDFYFTQQFGDDKTIFQFHPLFRAFLLHQGEKHFTVKVFNTLKKQAADILQDDYPEAAFNLYSSSRQYADNIRLICQLAPAFLQQGRFQTLQYWISQLPDSITEKTPWVLYWQGICLTFQNPLIARQPLDQAYTLFIKLDDPMGAMLACSGIIDTFPMLWGDFNPMDIWIDRLETILNNIDKLPPEVEHRISNSMLIGYACRRSEQLDTQKWLTRGKHIAQHCPDPFIRTLSFQFCYFLELWSGNLSNSQILLENMQATMTGDKSIPMTRIWWNTCESVNHWHFAETDKAIKSAETALQLAEQTGVRVMEVLAHYHAAIANLSTGRIDAGRLCIESLQPLIVPGQLMNEVCYQQVAGILAWHDGDLSKANTCLKHAVELANQAGLSFAIGTMTVGYALILFEQGKTKEAHQILDKAHRLAHSKKHNYVLFEAELFQAYFNFIQGDHQTAVKTLASALARGRESRRIGTAWWHPTIMSYLCSKAIKANIETDYVCEIVRKRKLLPNLENQATQLGTSWPWPLRITTFGGLRILIDDEPLLAEGKPQSKPIELLMALISYGAIQVERTKLADTLWPDADGNDALESFKTTLRRLRKLLQHNHVLPLQDGKLSLNKDLCWLDTWALSQLLNEHINIEKMDTKTIHHTFITLMQLYTGPFLDSEEENSRSLQTREQFRNKFLHHIIQLGEKFESQQHWQDAINYYEKAVQVEELAEVLYQRLIICYQKIGLTAEALNIYKRCKKQLKENYGIQPSAKTLELARNVTSDL